VPDRTDQRSGSRPLLFGSLRAARRPRSGLRRIRLKPG
jgi:hypothetical protein